MGFKLELNHDAEKLSDAFKIPNERYDELANIVVETLKEKRAVSRAIEVFANECQNLNELVVAAFLFGVAIGELRASRMIGGLLGGLL